MPVASQAKLVAWHSEIQILYSVKVATIGMSAMPSMLH